MNISESFIYDAGHRALEEYGYEYKDNCDLINDAILNNIEKWSNSDVDLGQSNRCAVNETPHYVATIPSSMYAEVETNTGHIIIDGALKQFEDELGEDIPSIVILTPEDSRRQKWYDYLPTIS